MNFIFIGGTRRGLDVLKTFIEKGYYPDFAVVLKEEEHETIKISLEIIKLLETKGVKYFCKKKLGKEECDLIKEKKRDFAIVCGWRTLIDPNLRLQFNYGFLAAHDSLLPKYRGFAPLNWAMICGETETGVTLFQITDGDVDSGPVFGQKIVSIEPDEYAEDVYKKIIRATTELYLEFLDRLKKNEKIIFVEQDESTATYTCKRIPEDGKIRWDQTSIEILSLIRALAPPYPGAFCGFKGEDFVISKARLGMQNSKIFAKYIPGRVISISNDGVEVMCGRGSILINEWIKKGIANNPCENIKSISTTLS